MLIGLFGGTFDPPHLGHLTLCRLAYAQLALDRLLWILTPDPPHKKGRRITRWTQRLAMLEIALQGTPFEISRVDIDRAAPHYALDTVRLLAQENPGADLLYLMGSDSLNDLPTWHCPTDFVSALSYIGVMRRPGEIPDLPALEQVLPGLGAKLRFVEAPLMPISAQDLRRRVRAGLDFDQFVPAGVAIYIREHRLYLPQARHPTSQGSSS
jgi:nicotinate-nucleotide adenylyltransferase